MDNRPIGIFDSGIGGLTCVREMTRLLPSEDIIYFGDTARIPYGTRSRETVMMYAEQDIAFIRSHDVKLIIAACGTVSSMVGDMSEVGGIPFTGVVIPAARAACAATRSRKIGVIGTPATINSGAYEKAIHTIMNDAEVSGNSCPLFVPLAENGINSPDDIVVKAMVERYLEPIKKAGADTLILGCTHYPMLYDAISDYMGADTVLISSGAEAAVRAKDILTEGGMLSDRSGNGKAEFYCSDSVKMFTENARVFLGKDLAGTVKGIPIEKLTDRMPLAGCPCSHDAP